MNWLVLSYFLTAGLTLHQNVSIQSQSPAGDMVWQPPNNTVETTLGAELLAIDHIFLSASVKTDEAYLGIVSWAPFLSEYNVKIGARFGGFEIGYVDDCTHPELARQFYMPSLLYGEWSGFYISFRGSAKLF